MLAIAAFSQYSDIEVEIFEGAEKLAEVGAGIGLFPRERCYGSFIVLLSVTMKPGTWEIIKRLGLEKPLLQHTDLRPTEGPGEYLSNLDKCISDSSTIWSVFLLLSKERSSGWY